ncbi:SpoIIE family protein phosphatase [Haliangium ochraceum]|uniref:Protein serine/threonine phosphatase n=1 Tax=Haliangium ochraceum (strain DSM 14365 / JCM 11303 / SMP-2) TaxID=502025 RepID=D0LLS9_HALO1|nr:SpoIIE family protein phosphatase [Haliangium ochraceum]ACY15107.1 protein serine/threonine phosphatase [Haliangium ochraceum DSM 14365]
MWLFFVLLVANGFLAWLLATLWTRRRRGREAAEIERDLELVLNHASASLHARSLQEVFERATNCARDVWGGTGVMLVYLSSDRGACRVLRWGQSEHSLPASYWDELLAAPWTLGILTQAALEPAQWQRLTEPLAALFHDQAVDLIIPWIERDKLVCVTGMRMGRPLQERDYALLDLWNMGVIQACANHVIEGRVAPPDLAGEVEQANRLVQGFSSRKVRGELAGLSWLIHERRHSDDQFGNAFWDARLLSDGRLVVIAGENIATGLAASMLSTAINGCCDTLHELAGDEITPGRVLAHINRFLWRRINPLGMACIALVVDPQAGRIEHAVAGPLALWRLRWGEQGAELQPYPHRTPLLGDRLDVDFESRVGQMSEGDVFLALPQSLSAAAWPHQRAGRDPRFDSAQQAPLEQLGQYVLGAAANATRGDSAPLVLVRRGE